VVSEALDFLVDLLDLEPIEINIFRGISPNEDRQRVSEARWQLSR